MEPLEPWLNPPLSVAEQSLTVEDGPLSPLSIRQQFSVAEHSLAVEDGPLSPLSIRQQSSVAEQSCHAITYPVNN